MRLDRWGPGLSAGITSFLGQLHFESLSRFDLVNKKNTTEAMQCSYKWLFLLGIHFLGVLIKSLLIGDPE